MAALHLHQARPCIRTGPLIKVWAIDVTRGRTARCARHPSMALPNLL